MTKIPYVALLVLFPLSIGACGGDGGGGVETGSRLRFLLTDESRMSTVIGLRPPRDERTLAGELEVEVQDKSADRIALKVLSLSLRSVEDDLYDVKTQSGGVISVHRTDGIQAEVGVVVNDEEERVFRGAMVGQYRSVLLDLDPPALGAVSIRNDSNDFGDRARRTYIMTIFATVTGQPVPTPKPLE